MPEEGHERDWFERLDDYVTDYPRRASGFFVAAVICAIAAVKLAIVMRDADIETRKEQAALRRHWEWLERMPDAEKRTWPVVSYCSPASASGGVCHCDASWEPYVAWPERLPNGDIACHKQR